MKNWNCLNSRISTGTEYRNVLVQRLRNVNQGERVGAPDKLELSNRIVNHGAKINERAATLLRSVQWN